MYTRREFGVLTLAALAAPRLAAAGFDPRVAGVRLGAQSYCFRDLPRGASGDSVDAVITAFKEVGLEECELWAPQVEPQFGPAGGGRGAPATPEALQARAKGRDELRAWRLKTPLDHFKEVKAKFAAAGISIYAYNYSFNDSFSDEEVDRGFDMAKALGAEIITASTTVSMSRRVVPFAEKHKMVVAMHGHSNATDPNEFATPESFAAALKMSKYFKINLDIGHFSAANYDPVAYLKAHHDDITNLHLKDRKKNQGDNVPWGQGDTPIREVLQLLKKEKWPIRAYVEYEYRGEGSSVEEVKKCFAFAKQALA
ncbi:MAG: TIM barrel protein [Vicinamibacterales bacterium]